MKRPLFIDNLDENTLARALDSLLDLARSDDSEGTEKPVSELRVAMAYFSPSGFAKVADRFAVIPRVRLLLGAEVTVGAPVERKRLEESPLGFERRRIKTRLNSLQEGL